MFSILMLLAGLLTATSASAQHAGADTQVALQPGDVIRIEVWREEDLSGEFLVDESGTVTLPLLGSRQVTGTPIPELRDELIAAYRRELRNPSITVTPLRRIYVLGEVNAPGLQIVDPTVSLAGVIALAGGAGPDGDLRRIQVYRDGQLIENRVAATRMLASLDVRSGDQIFVGQRSWFERNSTFIVSALLSVTSIVISITR